MLMSVKNLSVIVLAFGLGAMVATLPRQEPAAEAQGPACAPLLQPAPGVVVQDMNGDGMYNPINEVLRLLSWHFSGGPAPVPPCGGPLPATGQKRCFTTSGVEIGCADPFHPGQDGSSQLGCPREGRFVVVDEETVADTCLGLLWKRRPIDRNGDGFLDYNIDGYTWQEALQHCTRLGEGWRLPNVMELQSLVDYGEMATLDPQLFPIRHTPGLQRWHGEWTSTSNPAAPREAYLVIVGSFLAEAERGGSQTISYPKIDGRILLRAVRSLR
jgi:hypothetical protein